MVQQVPQVGPRLLIAGVRPEGERDVLSGLRDGTPDEQTGEQELEPVGLEARDVGPGKPNRGLPEQAHGEAGPAVVRIRRDPGRDLERSVAAVAIYAPRRIVPSALCARQAQ